MNGIQHAAICIQDKAYKNKLVQQLLNNGFPNDDINLGSLKGELYSIIALEEFIDEELKHDHFEVIQGSTRNLNSFSDGEQKKALLQYILAKKPGYIIVDNIFDSLDKASQRSILETLATISHSTIILQIANRKKDILPFIKTVYTIKGNQIVLQQSTDEYLANNVEETFHFPNAIPPPLQEYAAEQNPLIKFNNVSVSYEGRKIIHNICWEINSGEFWQLVGPNGSGKSTMLSMITGDNPKAYRENIILFGRQKGTGESVWQIKEKIGYFNSAIAQQFSRLHTIEQMILSGFFDSIGLYNKPSGRQTELARQWLLLIGLFDKKDKPFLSLSAGQQRLALIVRAMVKHPPVLILDEPTAGLDDYDASIFAALVNKIAEESNTAILYVSHREEAGLSPQFIYELTPAAAGSVGKVIKK